MAAASVCAAPPKNRDHEYYHKGSGGAHSYASDRPDDSYQPTSVCLMKTCHTSLGSKIFLKRSACDVESRD
jgi:hypothetical protein